MARPGSYRARAFALLEQEPSLSVSEIVQRLGCSRSTAKECRRAWRDGGWEKPAQVNAVYCSRCGIIESENNPVRNGRCLWCRLEMRGVNVREFYESGEAAACGCIAAR